MRVVVTGGRDYHKAHKLIARLSSLGITELAHGACETGADALADEWAKSRNIPCKQYPAHWHKLGNKAGPVRNHKMLTDFKPDVVIAFPGGSGTDHCVRTALRLGITVLPGEVDERRTAPNPA